MPSTRATHLVPSLADMEQTASASPLSRRTVLAAGALAAVGVAAGPGRAGAAGRHTAGMATSPTSTVDQAVWREHGAPLVRATGRGPLDGLRVAVKDLFEVEGHRVGAGNEAWLQEARSADATAPAVATLLGAGADVAGIARTDEFAYSLAGTNGHYGTPPNFAAPERIPGGSTSGPASAIALGQADVGLGTDTGGSIRIPAAYCGLYGLRPTHGAVSAGGLIPLAPSFDTVGWLTRDPRTLRRVGEVLLPPSSHTRVRRVVVADSLLQIADDEVATAVDRALTRWSAARGLPRIERLDVDASVLPEWVRLFQLQQGYEAWLAHGRWISQHWDSLNADVRARFEKASTYTRAQYDDAVVAVDGFRRTVEQLLGDAVLVLPSASSIAPTRAEAQLGGAVIEKARATTFQLTCIAGSSRRPALGLPVHESGSAPIGMCLVGPRGHDHALLGLAERVARQVTRVR